MKVFPNPSNSPAHYTRNLVIFNPSTIPATFKDMGGWVRAFDKVVNFHTEMFRGDGSPSLVSLHGLSPATKSLFLVYTSAASLGLLNFVCSFPPLEDLALIPYDLGSVPDGGKFPLTSPKLTGFLHLTTLISQARSTVRKLCGLVVFISPRSRCHSLSKILSQQQI